MTRTLALLALLLVSAPAAAAKRVYDVTPDEAAMKDDPHYPGAPAVVLDRHELTQDTWIHNSGSATGALLRTVDHIWRIKILTEEGRSYADVQIPFATNWLTSGKVENIEGRTLQPDGSTVQLVEKPHEKTIVKGEYAALRAIAFSLPDVRVGSVIEYRYRMTSRWSRHPTARWSVQYPLTTLRATFSMYPARGPWKFTYAGSVPVNVGKPNAVDGGVWMEIHNVPAVPDEPNMPPRDSVGWRIHLFYDSVDTTTADAFWARIGEFGTERIDTFVKDRRRIRKEAAAAIGTETDPGKKLRALYRRTQEIRNLSFEPAEKHPKKIAKADHAGDVLDNGYGTADEIAGVFLALARASGFEADLLWVGDRSTAPFDAQILDGDQLTSEVVQVWGEHAVLLDPGTPLCPYGVLAWRKTGSQGVRVAKTGGLITIPAPVPSSISRDAKLEVGGDGTLSGSVLLTLAGQEALVWRVSGYRLESGKRNDAARSWIAAGLPEGATVTVSGSEGWDDADVPFTVRFELEIPGWAQVTSQRILVPVEVFGTRRKNPFESTRRTLPVVFDYALVTTDRVRLEIPDGWTVESAPSSMTSSTPIGSHQFAARPDGSHVLIERAFDVNAIAIPATQYSSVRMLYTSAMSDPERLVLRANPAP